MRKIIYKKASCALAFTYNRRSVCWGLIETVLTDLQNKIFPKYRIYAGTKQIIKIFIIEQIQWKLMTQFFFTLKKPYFWAISPNFGVKISKSLSRTKWWGFPAPCQRNLRIQFQENTWKDSTMEGWIDPIL